MSKQEFLSRLRQALSGLPEDDVAERIAFYSESIDDRIEEGMSEEEAVACVGSVEEIRAQVLSEIPLPKLVKEKVKPKRALRAWEVVLIVLGFPVWFPLTVASCVIVFALYIVLWALVIALWAVVLSFFVVSIAGLALTVVQFAQKQPVQALLILGASLFLAGASVLLFFAAVAASKGVVKLTKKIGVGTKNIFVKKEK